MTRFSVYLQGCPGSSRKPHGRDHKQRRRDQVVYFKAEVMVFADGSNVGQSMESLLWLLLTWTVPLLVSLLYKTLSFSLLSTRPRAKADRFVQSRYNRPCLDGDSLLHT